MPDAHALIGCAAVKISEAGLRASWVIVASWPQVVARVQRLRRAPFTGCSLSTAFQFVAEFVEYCFPLDEFLRSCPFVLQKSRSGPIRAARMIGVSRDVTLRERSNGPGGHTRGPGVFDIPARLSACAPVPKAKGVAPLALGSARADADPMPVGRVSAATIALAVRFRRSHHTRGPPVAICRRW